MVIKLTVLISKAGSLVVPWRDWRSPGQITNKLMCYPQQLGWCWKGFVPEPSGTLFAMCTGHLSNSVCYLHRNHPKLHRPSEPEPYQPSAPEQSGSLSAFCHYAIELSINLACCLHQNPPEFRQPSAPEPSGTSSAICTGTLQNLISNLHHNPPEPHQPSAPETAGTLSAICTGRLRNPPEPSSEPGVAAAPDRTRAILG